MNLILKPLGWCLNLAINLVALVLLYALAWPVYLIVHYVIGPVLYAALYLYGMIVTGVFTCIAVPTRLAFKYLFMPPARIIISPYVRMRLNQLQTNNFRTQFNIGQQGFTFTHDELVFGPDRFHLGRAKMILQTAESDLECAQELAADGWWFACLGRIWRAEDHLANVRTEMNLIAQQQYLQGRGAYATVEPGTAEPVPAICI